MLRLLALAFLLAGCIEGVQIQEPTEQRLETPGPESGACEASQRWVQEFVLGGPTLQILGNGVGGWIYEDRMLEPDTSSLKLSVEWNQTPTEPRIVVDILADGLPDGEILAHQSGDSPLRLDLNLTEPMREVRVRTQYERTTLGPVTVGFAGMTAMHYNLTESSGSC